MPRSMPHWNRRRRTIASLHSARFSSPRRHWNGHGVQVSHDRSGYNCADVTTPIAEEPLMDSALKQRLIGAAVLIALAVIFVPMFLGNAPPQPQNTTLNLDIPKPPDRDFQTRTLPVTGTESVATPAANPDKVVTVDTHATPVV